MLGVFPESTKCPIVSGSNLVQQQDQFFFVNKAQGNHGHKSNSAIIQYCEFCEIVTSVELKKSKKKVTSGREVCEHRNRRYHRNNIPVYHIFSYEKRPN